MNSRRLQRALLAILWKVGVESDNGFGGCCIEMDRLHLTAGRLGQPTTPFSPEEMEIIVQRTAGMLQASHTIKYYGSRTYLPEGMELFHNMNGAWVGPLLVIDENEDYAQMRMTEEEGV